MEGISSGGRDSRTTRKILIDREEGKRMNGVFNDRLSDKERKGSLLTYQLPQTSRR